MNNEINTAVAAGAPAGWIVLNDAGFGIVRDGMTLSKLDPFASRIPRVDFVAFARAQGGDGVHVDNERALGPALGQALLAKKPFVVDGLMDENSVSPAIAGRVLRLRRSTASHERRSRGTLMSQTTAGLSPA